MKFFIYAVIVLAIQTVPAATEVSNGADARVCRGSDSKLTAELLELSDIRRRPISTRPYIENIFLPFITHIKKLGFDHQALVSTEKDIVTILNSLLEDFARFHPGRAALYKNQLDKFWKNTKWLAGKDMADIDDSNSWYPRVKGCRIEQLIVQRTLGINKSYEINMDIWKILPLVDKAAAVLHELVYGELIALGYTNASVVENFVATMLRSEWHKSWFSKQREDGRLTFIIRAEAAQMPIVNWHQWQIPLQEPLVVRTARGRGYSIETTYYSGFWVNHETHKMAGARLATGQTIWVGDKNFNLSNRNVGFYPSAKIRFIVFKKNRMVFKIDGKKHRCFSMMELSEEGLFKACPKSLLEMEKWLAKYAVWLGVLDTSRWELGY